MTSKALTVIERAAVALNSAENKAKLQELVAQSVSIVEIKNTARIKQEKKLAEKQRRAREEFIEKGPTDDELVDVLAGHYGVTVGDVLRWLEAFDIAAFKANFAA